MSTPAERAARDLAYTHRGEVVPGSAVALEPAHLGRSYTVRIPAPDEFINANHRRHRMVMAGRVRSWRFAGAVWARKAKLPKMQRARICAELHFADGRRRDDHNYFGTVKALIDGIVGDYGALPDDTASHLVGVEIRRGVQVPPARYGPSGAVTIHLIEVPS